MKKRKQKRLSKLAKIFLVFCMLFTQFASPVKIMAEEITDVNNIIIDNTVNEDSIIFNNNITGDYLDEDYYIVKADLQITYDNGKIMNESQATLVNGLLTSPNVEFTFNKKVNGTYILTTNIYYIGQDISTIINSDAELIKYIEDNNLEAKDSITSKEVVVNDLRNELDVTITGNNVTGDNTNGYNVPLDTNVSFSLTPYLGNYNPDTSSDGYYEMITNNTFVNNISANEELVFSNLYAGDYTLTFNYYNQNNELLLTKDIIIHYGDVTQNISIKDYFNLDNINTIDEALNLYLSYTSLTDEQKNDLDSNWEEQINSFIVDKQLENIKDITFKDGLVTSSKFNGMFNETDSLMTVGELKQEISSQISNASVIVYDNAGNIANEVSKIATGMKVYINIEGYESTYEIVVKGDTNDGKINIEDVRKIVNGVTGNEILTNAQINAADLNNDGVIDLKEASIYTSSLNTNSFTIEDKGITDKLNATLQTNGTNNGAIAKGKEFTVDFYLSGFKNSEINAILGNLNFDSNALDMVGFDIDNNISNYNKTNNKFIVTTQEDIKMDSLIASFTFVVKTDAIEGQTYTISLDNTSVAKSLSTSTVDTTNASTSVTIIKLSSNNNLNMLTPSTGSFDKEFNPDVTDYKLYVPSGTQTITFTGSLADLTSNTDGFTTYTLTGDTTTITINVTAEDGSVKTYTIEVIREAKEVTTEQTSQTTAAPVVSTMENQVTTNTTTNDNDGEETEEVTEDQTKDDDEEKTEDEEEEQQESSIDKIIIIILIILVILGLLYLIFKKDDDDDEQIIKK